MAIKRKTPENIVKDQIKDYLSHCGWYNFPILQGLGSKKGITDRIAVKNGVVLFIEAKAPNGDQSDEQKEFQRDIEAAGGHYILARGWEDIANYLRERGIKA